MMLEIAGLYTLLAFETRNYRYGHFVGNHSLANLI